MAHHTHSSKPRHVTQQRRAHKRRVREDALRHELELRDHSPARAPEHPPRRQSHPRSPFWKIVRRAVLVLAFFGVAELVVASLTAEPFQVKKLEVSGCTITEGDHVLQLAQPLVGQNFIRANTRKISREIETIPTVGKAYVSRVIDWPPRLHITIEERQAFAQVGAGNNWFVVDKSGVAFRPAGSEDTGLYAITSPKLGPELGAALPAEEWRPVVEITNALQTQGGQNWKLRRIYFDKDGSAALRLSGGYHDETLIRLGGDHWEQKLVRAREALDFFEQNGKHAAVLNLVSYEMPQWTPRVVESSKAAKAEESSADTSSET